MEGLISGVGTLYVVFTRKDCLDSFDSSVLADPIQWPMSSSNEAGACSGVLSTWLKSIEISVCFFFSSEIPLESFGSIPNTFSSFWVAKDSSKLEIGCGTYRRGGFQIYWDYPKDCWVNPPQLWLRRFEGFKKQVSSMKRCSFRVIGRKPSSCLICYLDRRSSYTLFRGTRVDVYSPGQGASGCTLPLFFFTYLKTHLTDFPLLSSDSFQSLIELLEDALERTRSLFIGIT